LRHITLLDRLLLLLTCLLAAYQVVFGIEGSPSFALLCYTIGFGVLLVAGLLMIILGFEVLESTVVVIISTVIPLSLSLGLVAEYLPHLTIPYLIFSIIGLIVVAITRFYAPQRIAVLSLAIVHGVSGLIITLLPIILSMRGVVKPGFVLVGVGGALIGLGGLLLYFLKTGSPILSRPTIQALFPGLLLLTTLAFAAGFAAA